MFTRTRTRLGMAVAGLALVATAGCAYLDPVDPAPDPAASTDPYAVRAGAVPLGAASYDVPAGARFVSPSGSDAAAGTEAAPWRTVGHAVSAVPSGSTLVLRAGTYRETVQVPSTKRLTLQNYPGEAAVFSGSTPVTGWVDEGGVWRKDGWTAEFDHSGLDSRLVQPSFPMAGHPDMAFVDGTPLRQVEGRSAVGPGTFFVDPASNRLYIGTDPTGHTVEASVRTYGLHVFSGGTVVRGLGFQHYATSVTGLGAAKASGPGAVFENNVFRDNAAAGLYIIAPDGQVRNNTAERNGQMGIGGHLAHRLLVKGNLVRRNNFERFHPESAAGGVKVTTSTYVTMRDNIVDDHLGHGLWFDMSSHHATIVRNVTRRTDGGAGIEFEYSDHALIAGNVSTDNDAGIQTAESSYVEAWNNTLMDNKMAFAGYDDPRGQRPVGLTLRNNVLSTSRGSHVPLLVNGDLTQTRGWDEMQWSTDHNAFYRRSTATAPWTADIANWPSGKLHYRTVQTMQSGLGQDRSSLAADNVATNPYVANPDAGDYRTPADPQVSRGGTPLPDLIARAIGLPAGEPTFIGAHVVT